MSGWATAAVIILVLVCGGILAWRLVTDPHFHCIAAGKILICWRDHR